MTQNEHTYRVTIPIAGHATIEIRAANKKEAISNAFKSTDKNTAIEWDTLHRFTEGNVCYCPRPWQIEVEVIDDD